MTFLAAQLGVPTDQVEMLLVPARSQMIEGLLTVTLHTGRLVAIRMRTVVATFAVLIETQEARFALGQDRYVGIWVTFLASELEVSPVHLKTDQSVIEELRISDVGEHKALPVDDSKVLTVMITVTEHAEHGLVADERAMQAYRLLDLIVDSVMAIEASFGHGDPPAAMALAAVQPAAEFGHAPMHRSQRSGIPAGEIAKRQVEHCRRREDSDPGL